MRVGPSVEINSLNHFICENVFSLPSPLNDSLSGYIILDFFFFLLSSFMVSNVADEILPNCLCFVGNQYPLPGSYESSSAYP